MARKTQGVYDLVVRALEQLPKPYGEDVIEDVCLRIQTDPNLLQSYEYLQTDLAKHTINSRIGHYTRQLTGATAVQRKVAAKRSNIIVAYSKLEF